LLFVMMTTFFIFPSWINACFFYLFCAYLAPYKVLRSFFVIVTALIPFVYFFDGPILNRNTVIFLTIVGIFALILPLARAAFPAGYRFALSYFRFPILYLSISICAFVSVILGFRHMQLSYSYSHLLNLHRSEASFYSSLAHFNPHFDIELRNFLNSYADSRGPIGVLLPLNGQSYWDHVFYPQRIALTRGDFALAVFSSSHFEKLSNKINGMLGRSPGFILENGYKKAELFDAIDFSLFPSTCEDLRRLSFNGIFFYVSSAPVAHLVEILTMKTTNYYIYDISAVRCPP
jgi:hypothetical protein